VIVLDTNVLSETLRRSPSSVVLEWLRRIPLVELFTTTITEGEMLYGLACLPEGARRRALEANVLPLLTENFAGRILPFDSAAAREFADIAAARRRGGRPISEADARIAAITRSRGARLATRDEAGFSDCGLQIVNPWT
jgi:toxin FitB